jgi:hypothetical protein
MNRAIVSTLAVVVLLSGCATSNQKSEIRTGYAIYDVKVDPAVDARRVYAAVKDGLEKTGYEFSVSIDPPPSPLPAQPSRFQLVDPLKNSNLGALIAASGQSFKTAKCDGASFVAGLKNDHFKRYGEDTAFVTCVFPYAGGFSVNVWHRYSQQSGNIGASLARSVVGDSSQFIPRTIESIINGMRAAGLDPRSVENF